MTAPTLAALRSAGAWRVDPVRFRYLEALEKRAEAQPQEAVRALLQARLQQAVAAYAQRVAEARPLLAPAPRRRQHAAPACTPLAELNAYIRGQASARNAAGPTALGHEPEELGSARRFRQAMARGLGVRKVQQAIARKPANAGPLNSHALVLQSLALLQDLSPDYLRRFIAHVEALQWLEDLQPPAKAAPAKKRAAPARRK